MSSNIKTCIAAPPPNPEVRQAIRLRRLGLSEATARAVAALAYGQPIDRWRFTSEPSSLGVRNHG